MIIPNKHSGYFRDGIRLYPGGGGGGGGGDPGSADGESGVASTGTPASDAAAASSSDGPGGGGGPNDPSGPIARVPGAPAASRQLTSPVWNNAQMGSSPANLARDLALSRTVGGRPSSTDFQFFQPAYQPSYQNYANPGSAMGVSQYGQRPPAIRTPQPRNPFTTDRRDRYTTPPVQTFQPPPFPVQPQTPSTTDQRTQFAGLISSGNYQGGVDYARKLGFSDADIAAHIGASGLKDSADNVISQDIANKFLSGYKAQPAPRPTGLGTDPSSLPPSAQQPGIQSPGGFIHFGIDEYGRDAGSGFGTAPPVGAVPMTGGGRFDPYQPQMQQHQQYPQQLRNPFTSNYRQTAPPPINQIPPRAASGPSQAIVSRSAQMRGAPNVIRRAEGGIASLIQRK